jgi:hypothetical protein
VPQQINYQGYLTNTSGNALDTTVAMTFKLYTDSLAGSLLWTETRPSVTVTKGLFNVRLGQVTSLGDAVFNNAQIWLGITVGNNTEMTPRSRIVSVGYSYRVGTVDGASGGTITGNVNIVGKGNIGLNNSNSGLYAFVAGYNDTASGDYSTVSGGLSNDATGSLATVGGGVSNIASGFRATVGGGDRNIASGDAATMDGGYLNTAGGDYATVGGGSDNTCSGNYAAVSGGYINTASANYATVGGGSHNDATNANATVGGGYDNTANNTSATVGGGQYNRARGQYSVVAGGGGASLADSNSASGN